MAVMHMDVDEARIERALRRDRSVRLGVVERRIAVARDGMSARAIGEVLGLWPRSVGRLRAANRRAA